MRRPFLDEPVERGEPYLTQIKQAARADKAKGTKPAGPKPYDGEVAKSIEPVATSSPDIGAALHRAFTKVADHLQDHEGTATLGTVGHAFRTVAHELKPPAGTGEVEEDL